MQEYKTVVRLPQSYLDLINQIFEIEKKLSQLQEANSIQRNINRIKTIIEEELFKHKDEANSFGISYHNPLNESFDDTRTDCEANIAGSETENLEITEVIKPIIFCSYFENEKPVKRIVQKGVVVVKSKNH